MFQNSLFVLFDFILYVPSTISQLTGTGLHGLNQYLARINVSCSRTTTHWCLVVSQALYHWATYTIIRRFTKCFQNSKQSAPQLFHCYQQLLLLADNPRKQFVHLHQDRTSILIWILTIWYSNSVPEIIFWETLFGKKVRRRQQKHKNYPACRVN